jgi:transcriptional regulator with XRE-family HTH domain
MEREEIVTLIKAVKSSSGFTNKDLAEKLGISATRLSTITSQGDMMLSTFTRLLEVAGLQMEVSPSVEGAVVRVAKNNKCNECEYKKIAEQVDSANVHLDEKTKKLVIEI